eukprot:CRZ02762.1 hypothetical protein [Spongospora subterranea]
MISCKRLYRYAAVLIGSGSIALDNGQGTPPCISKRDATIARTASTQYDILIVGGGATGCGVALDAVNRGLSTCLIEADDFGSGTSSRSSKLIHGGVRYLEKAVTNADLSQLSLVSDALRERRHMMSIAPHLTTCLPIIVPIYDAYPYVLFTAPYYYFGMKVYDLVCGFKGALKSSYFMGKQETIDQFPAIQQDNLKCSIVYYDGLQEDARMNLSLALTAEEDGADVVNHVRMEGFIKNDQGAIIGVKLHDTISNIKWDCFAKVVVNASGPFSDSIRHLDDSSLPNIICPSIGVHITLPQDCSAGGAGLLIPKTVDGRVLFLLPWEGSTIAGTTDAPTTVTVLPEAKQQEIQWILDQLATVLSRPLTLSDVKSSWAGIRPLASPPSNANGGTKSISRDHMIDVNGISGLFTIAGGKWTTYRSMSEDIINRVLLLHPKLSKGKPCSTYGRKLIGAETWFQELHEAIETAGFAPDIAQHLSHAYGDRYTRVLNLCAESDLNLNHRIIDCLPYIRAEVVYGVREEHALTAVDILARRTRMA